MAKARVLASLFLLVALNFELAHCSRHLKFSLEEDISEAIEILFGEEAQDDFAEFIHTCPTAKRAIRDVENCLAPLNLTYERFSDLKHTPFPSYSKIFEDINNSVSRCIRPAIDAIRSNVCANDPSLYETMETVYKAVANSATYLRSSFNMQGLMQEGLPECFVRRPGRQIAKCFPGRSGYGRSRDYLSYHVGDQLFNSANCRLLRKQADCAIKSFSHCDREERDSFKDVPVFRNLVETFYRGLCEGDYYPSAIINGSSVIAFSWLMLLPSLLFIKFL